MRSNILAVLALVGVLIGVTVPASALEADPQDLEAVMGALRAPGATERPLVFQTDEGFLRFLGAPPGGHYVVDTPAKNAAPEQAARTFLETHGKAFGLVSDRVGLRRTRTVPLGVRTVVRMEQTYNGLRVFGAEVVVQVNAAGDVLSVASDIARDLRGLDSGAIPLAPRVDAATASAKAKTGVAGRSENVTEADLRVSEGPELMIYQPTVLGLSGAARLVWSMEVVSTKQPPVKEAVLIDAQSGEEALHFSLIMDGRLRIIYDLNNTNYIPATPARVETQGPTGIADVDNAYDFLGDTYSFFLTHHDWDNFDNGQETPLGGYSFMPITAYVRLPLVNAFFMSAGPYSAFYFGTDFVVDDVTAHEFTHGVTQYASNLEYQGFSGAISESFSDIWGEFVDLTNGRGDDSDAVRWLCGEDIPEYLLELMVPGALERGIRDMKDPTVFGDPDRLNSPLVIPPNSGYDNGGVHINSGIGNKLCYLLTDGDEFNNRKVEGLGIDTTADLFWECQMTLPKTADYHDLYFALMQGAVNLDLAFEQRLNVLAGCQAVEIVPPGESAVFQATATETLEGQPAVSLYWEVPNPSLLANTIIVRSTTGYTTEAGEGLVIEPGLESKYLDLDVLPGVEYFYTLVQDHLDGSLLISQANAIAGTGQLNYLTEAFGRAHGIDLANSQLTFTPVGAPAGAIDSPMQTGYERYEVTRAHNVFRLPVPRSDAQGSAYSLTFLQNDAVSFYTGGRPFYFFGIYYPYIYLYENGYIVFSPIATWDFDNFPSLAAHFDVPRISFLFADLAVNIGGTAWARRLDDRLVFTFEQVPENQGRSFPAPDTNTMQVELFDNGQIRFTYLQLSVENAVVGLSNGQGRPVDPADLFDNVAGRTTETDLSQSPLSPSRLRIEPIAMPIVDAGERVTFPVQATAPAGAATPQLTATWDLAQPIPFADNGNGTARFDWQTTLSDAGTYALRIMATSGVEVAYQDVRIVVGEVYEAPEASGLRLSTGLPLENPSLSRDIPPGVPLSAAYTYSQPQGHAEGPSQLYWYRNSALVPGLTNRWNVPATQVQGGESWSFSILPFSQYYVMGAEAFSPVVHVLAVPQLDSVTPNFGEIAGGDRVIVQGRWLNMPMQVTFGGIKADQVFSLGDEQLEVVTPLHLAGTVDVVVKTPSGTGVLQQAFTFTPDASKVPNPDVNGDGAVDALDLQIVVNAILSQAKSQLNADANRDGYVNALDMQTVVNAALYR